MADGSPLSHQARRHFHEAGLLSAITVETGLEHLVTDALAGGRDVVITGSAGGGKTLLIRRVRQMLETASPDPVVTLPWNDASWRGYAGPPAVRVVDDLTAVATRDRTLAVSHVPGVRAVLAAANEGTLGTLAGSPMDSALELLHEMQQGRDPSQSGAPVVVDLAGFNPFTGAFERILSLDLLNQLVERCCDERETCPRWRSWQLLREPSVCSRLNTLVARSLGTNEVLFREIWDFVADLVLGGDCETEPPTSAWFWRVFYGDSALADRLRRVADPSVLAFPGDEIRMYYGDWLGIDAQAATGSFVWLGTQPCRAERPVAREMMNWLKAEVALAGSGGGLEPRFSSGTQQQIDEAVQTGSPDYLIEALNAYQHYNLEPHISRNTLDLWVDLSIERRQRRPSGVFSLGSIPRGRLQVVRALLVGNADADVRGSRAFLAGPDGVALRLDERLLNALSRGRSVRLADRQDDDIDWAIWNFYVRLSMSVTVEPLTTITILSFGDDFRSVESHAWVMDPADLRIEPRL